MSTAPISATLEIFRNVRNDPRLAELLTVANRSPTLVTILNQLEAAHLGGREDLAIRFDGDVPTAYHPGSQLIVIGDAYLNRVPTGERLAGAIVLAQEVTHALHHQAIIAADKSRETNLAPAPSWLKRRGCPPPPPAPPALPAAWRGRSSRCG